MDIAVLISPHITYSQAGRGTFINNKGTPSCLVFPHLLLSTIGSIAQKCSRIHFLFFLPYFVPALFHKSGF